MYSADSASDGDCEDNKPHDDHPRKKVKIHHKQGRKQLQSNRGIMHIYIKLQPHNKPQPAVVLRKC